MRWFAILMIAAIFGFGGGCGPASRGRAAPEEGGAGTGAGEALGPPANRRGNGSGPDGGPPEGIYTARRERMVRSQIEARGIRDERVLAAMRRVPRHLFVPESEREAAYDDGPLPIGEGQTISQPYIVALMTELIKPKPTDRVLEIGTGSAYQAAVLAELVAEVDTIEIVRPLGVRAAALLEDMGYKNVHCLIGDGYRGWPDKAPFDAILVTAAPEKIPEPLKQQLAIGGRLVIPVGASAQDLIRITRTESGFRQERIAPVRFVPMTGEAEADR